MLMIGCVGCHTARQSGGGDDRPYSVVFEPGGIYASMRIPALAITSKHTLLAFCEARIGNASDWADMHLSLRRSTDGGRTWSETQILDSMKQAPVGNPVPIVDAEGTIHLLYQKDYARGFYTFSKDEGKSWSPVVEITDVYNQFKPEYNWKVLAPGPGHGIQLKSGRLLAPVWLADSRKLTPRRSHAPSCVTTIYSDDLGKTWKRGEIVADSSAIISNPNESMPVELPDGRVLMSIRNPSAVKRRAFSTSADGISGWSEVRFAEELFDPTCMAPIASVTVKGRPALLFINPDSRNIEKTPRKNLSAKLSFDNGATWPVNHVIDTSAAGYSDIAVGKDGSVYCLYETNTNGNKGFNYTLVLKKINISSLSK
ncbi:glycoside hydrolase [Chitinophaga sedimenti]|uniref:sialidase family protein n=1 Tax=Chitinophaga sedimenti TaxID=2033606 RepID=UPI00200449D7|nr:sialidase family protein [Chitinophaga sedimenti]MCK7555505.1 glycoside hydrolase [Chitinophaga sedimenti]